MMWLIISCKKLFSHVSIVFSNIYHKKKKKKLWTWCAYEKDTCVRLGRMLSTWDLFG